MLSPGAQADKQLGRQFAHPYHFEPSDAPRAEEHVPSGSVRVQVSYHSRSVSPTDLIGAKICC
jgi:hypothetical protein